MAGIETDFYDQSTSLAETGYSRAVLEPQVAEAIGGLATEPVVKQEEATEETIPGECISFINESTDKLSTMGLFPSRTARAALVKQGLGVIGFDGFDGLQEAEDSPPISAEDEETIAMLLLRLSFGCLPLVEKVMTLNENGVTSMEIEESSASEEIEAIRIGSLQRFFKLRGTRNTDRARQELQAVYTDLKRTQEQINREEIERMTRRMSHISDSIYDFTIHQSPKLPFSLPEAER